MAAAAADPLAAAVICAHDAAAVDRNGDDPGKPGHGQACSLCDLTCGGGYAPLPSPAATVLPAPEPLDVAHAPAPAAVLPPSQLDHIRGRAPPGLSEDDDV